MPGGTPNAGASHLARAATDATAATHASPRTVTAGKAVAFLENAHNFHNYGDRELEQTGS
jgi:hypothetical protein